MMPISRSGLLAPPALVTAGGVRCGVVATAAAAAERAPRATRADNLGIVVMITSTSRRTRGAISGSPRRCYRRRPLAAPQESMTTRAARRASRASAEALVVRRRPVERRHLRLVEAQVHRELPAVVRKVAEGVLDDDVPRLLHHHVAAGGELPRRQQVRVARRAQRLARLLHAAVEDAGELLARLPRRRLVAAATRR